MIRKNLFGYTKDEKEVDKYTLENKKGTVVTIITLGGSIQSFVFQGIDMVLGFDRVEDYESQDAYMGAIVGRFANRIGNGTFQIEGKTYTLVKNNGPNHLHGGLDGFHRKVWRSEVTEDSLHLYYTSPNGEEGYPGTLETEVIYSLDEEDALSIQYKAKSDQDTVINLTNHSYFNLNGHAYGSLEEHELQIFADRFTENDENSLPTGNIRIVMHSPMDFMHPQLLLRRINENYDQIVLGNGYDHNWIVTGNGFRRFLKAKGLQSGITMEVFSDQPAVQMYTANYLTVKAKGKEGVFYPKRSGICFETQGFPNSPNINHFPSPLLKAGQLYERKTTFRVKNR
ncbi:aldose epimerase family protein [Anaerotignum sp. MB30-C6]|uniref:aldose epimerase family protein n=1 Tax=Anaerotignum sp. MB30-C6 TaxID=3070814 RepID=UPI0027DB433A|nr:aldose epimerase family protein [Anaerotignum sp. MB30-C6]WMI80984.1 aldose epimerase family protein [Anaerotignum sp. MB30-C6]